MYKFGLHFALRAGQEHWNLRAVDSQLSVHTDTGGRRLLRYYVMKRMHPKTIFLRKAGNSWLTFFEKLMNVQYLNLPPNPNRLMVWLIQQGLAWQPRCVKTCCWEEAKNRQDGLKHWKNCSKSSECLQQRWEQWTMHYTHLGESGAPWT